MIMKKHEMSIGRKATQAFDKVVSQVVRRYDEAPQIDEAGDSEEGEGPPGGVDQVQVLEAQRADLTHLIQNVSGCRESKQGSL